MAAAMCSVHVLGRFDIAGNKEKKRRKELKLLQAVDESTSSTCTSWALLAALICALISTIARWIAAWPIKFQ
jgi:hypothetical protein